jgi:hypothetical protein
MACVWKDVLYDRYCWITDVPPSTGGISDLERGRLSVEYSFKHYELIDLCCCWRLEQVQRVQRRFCVDLVIIAVEGPASEEGVKKR